MLLNYENLRKINPLEKGKYWFLVYDNVSGKKSLDRKCVNHKENLLTLRREARISFSTIDNTRLSIVKTEQNEMLKISIDLVDFNFKLNKFDVNDKSVFEIDCDGNIMSHNKYDLNGKRLFIFKDYRGLSWYINRNEKKARDSLGYMIKSICSKKEYRGGGYKFFSDPSDYFLKPKYYYIENKENVACYSYYGKHFYISVSDMVSFCRIGESDWRLTILDRVSHEEIEILMFGKMQYDFRNLMLNKFGINLKQRANEYKISKNQKGGNNVVCFKKNDIESNEKKEKPFSYRHVLYGKSIEESSVGIPDYIYMHDISYVCDMRPLYVEVALNNGKKIKIKRIDDAVAFFEFMKNKYYKVIERDYYFQLKEDHDYLFSNRIVRNKKKYRKFNKK